MVDEHAGEQETSVMLHYHPELVEMERAGDGRVTPGKIPSLEEKVGWMPRHWDEVSADTGSDAPRKRPLRRGSGTLRRSSRKSHSCLWSWWKSDNTFTHGLKVHPFP